MAININPDALEMLRNLPVQYGSGNARIALYKKVQPILAALESERRENAVRDTQIRHALQAALGGGDERGISPPEGFIREALALIGDE